MCPSAAVVPHRLPYVGSGRKPAFGLSITEPDLECVHSGPGGHKMGHELGRTGASHAHPRRRVVPICAVVTLCSWL